MYGNLFSMEEEVIQTELDAWNWIAKFNEKITLLRLKVTDHKKFCEDDLNLVKVLFRIWHNGEFPLYETKLDLPSQIVTSNELFADETTAKVSTSSNGKVIDISL